MTYILPLLPAVRSNKSDNGLFVECLALALGVSCPYATSSTAKLLGGLVLSLLSLYATDIDPQDNYRKVRRTLNAQEVFAASLYDVRDLDTQINFNH